MEERLGWMFWMWRLAHRLELGSKRFGTPLQSAEANIDVIMAEFAGIIEYAVQYIAIATLD